MTDALLFVAGTNLFISDTILPLISETSLMSQRYLEINDLGRYPDVAKDVAKHKKTGDQY